MATKKSAESSAENKQKKSNGETCEQENARSNEQLEEKETVRVFRSEFDAMQCELEAAKSEAEKQSERAAEMTAQAQRLQAEFDNYRKRTNETNKMVRTDGAIDVLGKILPVIDAIEQAKAMIKDENTLSGLQIIDRQLGELLGSFNVERIEALGETFDPKLHNAVMEEEAPEESKGKVVKVYQQGYKIGDRILRHAVVIVGK